MGRHACWAASAARRNASAPTGWPSRARSASRTRSAVGATAPSATRASRQRSRLASSVRRAATQTTEISMARRRPAFRNAVAARAGSAGKLTRVSSSSGRRAVRFGPTRKRSTGSSRSPPGPTSVTAASRASRHGTRSAAGDALTRLPPTVPTLRTWCPPITSALSTRPRRAPANAGARSIARCVTRAPSAIRPLASMPVSPGTRPRPTTCRGATAPRSIWTIRSVPPARKLASAP